jgi:glycosyltransferase involved in cell wall biosynthesis
MACGLPCIGSTAGGIPELLPAEALVPSGDVQALYERIAEVANDPTRMKRMAAENLVRAYDFRSEVMQARRSEFYREVRRVTEGWLAAHPARVGPARVTFTDVLR